MLPTRQLTLEAPVLDGRASLYDAVRQVVGDHLRLTEREELHLTLFYVGRPADLFATVSAARADVTHRTLDEARFASELRDWLNRAALVWRHEIAVTAGLVETLGAGEGFALACRVTQPLGSLEEVHRAVLSDFVEFLEQRFGVPDGRDLLRRSSAFGYSGKSWVPHVTVATVDKSVEPVAFPGVELLLGPLHVRNIKSLISV